MNIRYALISLAALTAASPALAQVTLENKVMKETVVRTANGTQTVQTVPARTVTPGNTAVYVMTYRNGGAKPASNLVISNPVSRDVVYAGFVGSEPDVSVDGGKSFGRLAQLRVSTGGGASRAAQQTDVTNVRWTIVGPVAPGSSGSVSYKGVVR